MNETVVQPKAIPILEAVGIRHGRQVEGQWVIHATELVRAPCLQAVRAGVVLLNLPAFEDLCVRDGRVTSVVVNRIVISSALPVDPIVFQAEAVIDASGHETVTIGRLRERNLLAAHVDLPAGTRVLARARTSDASTPETNRLTEQAD
jgi:ribulose 1,5-bisphosphate synthetase/thiazole synthase